MPFSVLASNRTNGMASVPVYSLAGELLADVSVFDTWWQCLLTALEGKKAFGCKVHLACEAEDSLARSVLCRRVTK